MTVPRLHERGAPERLTARVPVGFCRGFCTSCRFRGAMFLGDDLRTHQPSLRQIRCRDDLGQIGPCCV